MLKKIIQYIADLWYNNIIRRIGSDIMNKEVNILDVAKILICKFNEEDKEITQLKLQKLLYFIEAYYMSVYDKEKLYNEKFYAWTYGPVSKEVYNEYKSFINLPIKENDCTNLKTFDEDIMNSINAVYNIFGNLNSSELIRLTHMQGSPWYDTPTNFDVEISKVKTKIWFGEKFLKNVKS